MILDFTPVSLVTTLDTVTTVPSLAEKKLSRKALE